MNDRNYIYLPRTGAEVLNAAPLGTKIYLYSDLCRKRGSPKNILLSLGRHSIILIQNPKQMNSGHWTSLSIFPETKEAFFFSSYGGKPDVEKNMWIPSRELQYSGQKRNVINDGLKQLAYEGWTIHYNDYPFQVEGDKTATCGIWATAFMQSGLNPDDFARCHLDLDDYYRAFFLKNE